jgi:hypothetical protein
MLGIGDDAFYTVSFGLADAAMTPHPNFLTAPASFSGQAVGNALS